MESVSRTAQGSVLIVLPTYNERECLPILVEQLRTVVPFAHVLAVDDNSPDGTGKLADSLPRMMPAFTPCTGASKTASGVHMWMPSVGLCCGATIASYRWMPTYHTPRRISEAYCMPQRNTDSCSDSLNEVGDSLFAFGIDGSPGGNEQYAGKKADHDAPWAALVLPPAQGVALCLCLPGGHVRLPHRESSKTHVATHLPTRQR